MPAPAKVRLRSLAIGAVLIGLALLWMRELELRTGIWVATGVPPLPALLFLALLLAGNVILKRARPQWAFSAAELIIIFVMVGFALVGARIRAEAGVPFHVVPWGMPKTFLENAFGTDGLLALSGVRGYVLLSSLNWLGRFWLPTMLAESQIESFKLADATHIRQRTMLYAVIAAVVLGIAGNFWAQTTAMFRWGELNMFHGGPQGSFNANVALGEFSSMTASLRSPASPRVAQAASAAIGGGVTLGMLLIRTGTRFGFLSPIGYLAATCWGEGNPFWFGFLEAWALKLIVLWIGGMPLYRRLIPGFLGLALGHFAGAGILMATIGLFMPDLGQLPSWF